MSGSLLLSLSRRAIQLIACCLAVMAGLIVRYGWQLAARDMEQQRLYHTIETERARLQALSRQLFDAQERERRIIARELHDELGQNLTLLRMTLERVGESLEHNGCSKKQLEQAKMLASQLAAQVRTLSLNLRPPMLDELGLLPTLIWHVGRFSEQSAIQVELEHQGVKDRRFTPEVETAAYRMVQEALTNVARHAGTSSAHVNIWCADETLGIEICDTGCGFDVEQALNAGNGLTGMQERLGLLNSRLTVDSSPGHGTRLIVEIPLAHQRQVV